MLEFNPMPAKQKYFFNLLLICAFNFNPVSAQEKSLENTSWQLIAIYGFNNSEFIPNNPENYLMRFRLESRLQIEADCNQAGATWTQEAYSLTLTDLVTTRKLCVQPSLFNRFIMNLDRSESYQLLDDQLILRTNSEADWMVFEPYVFVPSF
ncbi:MAG: META domain-containing protein [Pseudohongiellaceae bacterium]